MFNKKCFSMQAKMTKCSQKGVKIVYLFSETTYPEMQRKHRLYEYQSSTSKDPVDE